MKNRDEQNSTDSLEKHSREKALTETEETKKTLNVTFKTPEIDELWNYGKD